MIAVIGNTGYIGSAVCQRLTSLGVEHTGLRRLESLWSTGYVHGVDTVIYAAGPSGENAVQRDVANVANAWHAHVTNAFRLAQWVTLSPVRCVVYLSSLSVYGPPDDRIMPYDESARPNPSTLYAHMKWCGERQFSGVPSDRVRILRLAHVYGVSAAGRYPGGVVSDLVAKGLSGLPLTVRCGCWDFVHVEDAVTAILAALVWAPRDASAPVFNVGTGAFRLRDLALTVARATLGGPVHLDDATPGYNIVMDSTRAYRELKWAPVISPQAGISQLVAHLRQ